MDLSRTTLFAERICSTQFNHMFQQQICSMKFGGQFHAFDQRHLVGLPHFLPPPSGGQGPTSDTAMFPLAKLDPRLFRVPFPEEPKPQHSYIGLIAMAILSSSEKKLVLADIYQYILDNFPYFRYRGPGWRNSIRHNLSLNDCFIKAGRAANGKGHFWAVHPACQDDFQMGDFSRRKAQRKVRRHMGLFFDSEEAIELSSSGNSKLATDDDDEEDPEIDIETDDWTPSASPPLSDFSGRTSRSDDFLTDDDVNKYHDGQFLPVFDAHVKKDEPKKYTGESFRIDNLLAD